jgi:hypothetical protein
MTSLLPEGDNSFFLDFSHQTWALGPADLKSSCGGKGKDAKEEGRPYPYDPDMDVNDDDVDDNDPTVGGTAEKVTILPLRPTTLPSSFPSTFLGGTDGRIPHDHTPAPTTQSSTNKPLGGVVAGRSSSTNSCSDGHTVVTESSNTVPSYSFEIDLPAPVEISPLSWKESTTFKDCRNWDGHTEKLPVPPLEIIHRAGIDKDSKLNERSRAHSKSLTRKEERSLLTRSQSLLEDPLTSKYSSSHHSSTLPGGHLHKRRIRSRSDGRTITEDLDTPAATTTTTTNIRMTTTRKATTRSNKSKPQPRLVEAGTRPEVRGTGPNSRARERGGTTGVQVKAEKSPSSRRVHSERNREKSNGTPGSVSPSKSNRKSTIQGNSGRSLAPFRARSMSGTLSRRSSRDIYMEQSTSSRSKSNTRFHKSEASEIVSRTKGISNHVRSRTSVSPVKSQNTFHARTPSQHRRQVSSSNIQGHHATRPLDRKHSLRSRKSNTSLLKMEAETKEHNTGEDHFHVLECAENVPNVGPQDSQNPTLSSAATLGFTSPTAISAQTSPPPPSAPTTKREQAGSMLWSMLSPGAKSVDAQVKRANELIQRQKLKKEKSRLRRLSLDNYGESNHSSNVVQKEGNDEMTNVSEAMALVPSQSARNVFAALSRRLSKRSTGSHQAGTEATGPHSSRVGLNKEGNQSIQSTKKLADEDGCQTQLSPTGNTDATGLDGETHFMFPKQGGQFIESMARTSPPTKWSPRKAAQWMNRKGHEIAVTATGRVGEQRRILLDDNEQD